MTKTQFIEMCRALIDILESSTNQAIVRNVMRQVEDNVGEDPIALGIHELRAELQGSDRDADDNGLAYALEYLRESVAEANRSKNTAMSKRERDAIRDFNSIEEEIALKRKQKEEIKALALNHRSRLPNEDLDTYNAEINKKISALDNEIRSKRKEQIELRKEKGENKMENILQVKQNLTRDEQAMAIGLAAAKIIMAERSKGRVIHKLTSDEVREFTRIGNTAEAVASFTDGKVNLRDNPEFAAITTTAEEFIPATAQALGINNGGLFIPVDTLYTLLQIRPKASAFASRVRKLNIASMLKFPYSEGNTGAEWIDEGDCLPYEQNKFAKIELGRKGLGKYFVTTWELEAMTPENLLRYLLQEIRNEMDKAVNNAILYGEGSDATVTENNKTRKVPQPYGVTYQTSDTNKRGVSSIKKIIGTNGDYTDVLDAMSKIASDLLAENPNAVEGAEYFVSPAVHWELWNKLRAQSNGNFSVIQPLTMFGPNATPIHIDTELKGKDIIFGNPQNYIWNTILPIAIYNDKNIRCRQNMYGAFGMFDGVGIPKSFIYATDSTTPRGSVPVDVKAFRGKINYRGQNPVVVEE